MALTMGTRRRRLRAPFVLSRYRKKAPSLIRVVSKQSKRGVYKSALLSTILEKKEKKTHHAYIMAEDISVIEPGARRIRN